MTTENKAISRVDGWYWVRMLDEHGNVGAWEPAKWVGRVYSWYTLEWFGVAEFRVQCGDRIEHPQEATA